jgi:hypothetical protein
MSWLSQPWPNVYTSALFWLTSIFQQTLHWEDEMATRSPLLSILGFFLLVFTFTGSAQAQATRTWVSGVGDDVNPCSRTAPCKTFAGAISKTAAGGEINCIDPGGFGALTITKALTIDCSNTEAGVLVAGTNGIIVAAGPADRVVLRGLDLIGTAATPGLNGIVFNTGAALHVEKCTIREFLAAAPNGNGILFQPAAGTSLLFVTDTTLTNNSNAGVKVRPTGSGSATATILHSQASNNNAGFTADASAPTSGTVLMNVSSSTAAGNATTGISYISTAASGSTFGFVDRSLTSQNGTAGLNADGSHTGIVSGASTHWNNTAISAVNSAAMQSFGNNQVIGGGAFTLPMQTLK